MDGNNSDSCCSDHRVSSRGRGKEARVRLGDVKELDEGNVDEAYILRLTIATRKRCLRMCN